MVILVAFSFAQRNPEEEPNPCNQRLAAAVDRTVQAILKDGKGPVLIVAQWEIYDALILRGFHPRHLVEVNYYQVQYQGYYGVWDSARNEMLGNSEVTDLVLIANPLYELFYVKKLVRKDRFFVNTDYEKLIGWIGFDRKSKQWWTKGPVRYLVHRLQQLLTR